MTQSVNDERIPMPREINQWVLENALADISDFRGSQKEAVQVFREFYRAAVRLQYQFDYPGPNDLPSKAPNAYQRKPQ